MFYIYEIKNLLNDKTYIGQRKCPKNKIPENDKYMGSGVYLRNSKRKYGIKNFSKKIIAICETQENIDILEKIFIKLYRTDGKAEYNIAEGGNGGYTCEYMTKEQKEQYLKNLSKSLQGHFVSNETKLKISNANKGKKSHLNIKHSEETKLKISIKIKNIMKNSELRKTLSEKCGKSGKDNPFYGHHHSDEIKLKNSLAHKGKYIGKDNPFYGCHHLDETKLKISSYRKNKHWYNNGVIEIYKSECPNGFVTGRLKNK